MKIDIDRI